MTPLQIAESLSAAGLDHPAVDDAVAELRNWAKAEPVAWLTSIGVATNTPPLADSPLSKEWTPLYAHPSRGVVDEATWQCNNCRTRFTATDADWKRGFGRCAPACPSCKAFSQFTYPLGAAGLVDKIERMGFSCEGGPLANCTDWHKAKHALQAAALPAVPDAAKWAKKVREFSWRLDAHEQDIADELVAFLESFAATPAHDQPEGEG